MQSSHHVAPEAIQNSGPQYASFVPEGNHNPLAPQYAHSIPAVTLADYNAKAINVAANSQLQVVKQHPPFYDTPTVTWCDNCEMNVDTFTKYYTGYVFWICFFFFLFIMPVGLICILLNKRLLNVRHSCSKCHNKLGIHKAGKC